LRLAERRSRPILDALMNSDSTPAPDTRDANQEADPTASLEAPAPACVMCFNASDPSGAGGVPGDVATVAAMGAHALPVVTTIVMRDTAEVFDQHLLDAEIVAEQARSILEDVTVAGFKVGFLGSAEILGAVAEVLSDYADVPLVSYLPGLSWLDEDQQQPYLDAFRELILPATEVLVGNHQTLMDLLLPDWESERPASPRELAVAAGDHGTRYVLVTGVALPSKGPDQFIDNVLASPQGALTGEKFERFDTSFVGCGDTLAAALAALLAAGSELQAAVGEALAFLDQSLDAGFRPGMGHVVPDRFFWALPPDDEEEDDASGLVPTADDDDAAADGKVKGGPRRVH
jgi:hydroxymethylpyrimidine/phosphomethylpyrimidine kinase